MNHSLQLKERNILENQHFVLSKRKKSMFLECCKPSCRLFLEHKFSQKSTLFCLQIEAELAFSRYIDLVLESGYEKRLLLDVHEVKTSYERLLEKENIKVQKLEEDKQKLVEDKQKLEEDKLQMVKTFEERVKQGVDAALESMSSARKEA